MAKGVLHKAEFHPILDKLCVHFFNKVKPHGIHVLGQGSFGTVYRYEDIIIKLIYLPSDPPEEAKKMADSFNAEVEVLKEVSKIPSLKDYTPEFLDSRIYEFDAKIMGIHQFGFIAQRFEPVEELLELLIQAGANSKKKLSPAFSYGIFKHLVEGLDRLHKAGIVHRDIKPDNILIRKFAGDYSTLNVDDIHLKPIFIDFGLACKIPCPSMKIFKGSIEYAVPDFIPAGYRNLRNYNKQPNAINRVPTFNRSKQPYYIPPDYEPYTDNYALAKTIKYIYRETAWTDGEDEEKKGEMKEFIYRARGVAAGKMAAKLSEGLATRRAKAYKNGNLNLEALRRKRNETARVTNAKKLEEKCEKAPENSWWRRTFCSWRKRKQAGGRTFGTRRVG